MSIDVDDINKHDPEVETVISSLINYLKTDERLGDHVGRFYEEWSDGSLDECEVTLSAHTVTANHTHIAPIVEKTDPITGDDTKACALYRIGKYDITVQVDIWTAHKATRNELHKKFSDIINEEFLTGDYRATGLSLTLENYFDTIARYDIISYNFPDSERSAQDDDWRTRVVLNVHFDEKRQKVVSVMKQIEIISNDDVTGEEFISETVQI